MQNVNYHADMDMLYSDLLKRAMRRLEDMQGQELAARIGKSPSYVSKLINDVAKETPPPHVMAAIERVLEIPVAVQLRSWGYDIPNGPTPAYTDPDLAAVVAAWPMLLPDSRRIIVLALGMSDRARANQQDAHTQESATG